MCVNSCDIEPSMFDAALNIPHPFWLSIMLNRALNTTWNVWVCKWEDKGRAALLWGANTLRLKSYQLHEGSEVWCDVSGPWERYTIESAVQPIGSDIYGDTCVTMLQNFCRRKARKSFYHPPRAQWYNIHLWPQVMQGSPTTTTPIRLMFFGESGITSLCNMSNPNAKKCE